MPNKRILCVDDSDDIRELLRVVLGYSGFEAVGASNASEARRLMEGEQFGLYIIDWQLPGPSGLTLCEEIRARDECTPIIIFSGRAYESDRTEGMRAGANVYLCKPDVSKLIPSVTGLLEQPSVAYTEGKPRELSGFALLSPIPRRSSPYSQHTALELVERVKG